MGRLTSRRLVTQKPAGDTRLAQHCALLGHMALHTLQNVIQDTERLANVGGLC
jgi:hypothetical protein